MLVHGEHPFPDDMERMIRRLDEISPYIMHLALDAPLAWEKDECLEEGRQLLRELLERYETEGQSPPTLTEMVHFYRRQCVLNSGGRKSLASHV